jgi:hypothetical protein
MASSGTDKKDIWDPEAYTKKVAPFVPQLTSTVVSWLDPKPEGISFPPLLLSHYAHL